MTQRKPAGTGFESWVDQQIREAMERGEFDDLPGAGEPIRDLDEPYSEVLVRRILEREGVSTEELLPTPLMLRKQIERLPETVRDLRSEEDVREVARELDLQVVEWYRNPTRRDSPLAGIRVGRVDVEAVVARWRTERAELERTATEQTAAEQSTTEEPTPRPRWWSRLRRRRDRQT
ncbi:MAG TPA: DUF1992 domain-containing protein [Actinopolymorphaceae bacterium]